MKKRKIMWVLLILAILIGLSRLEVLKMRYKPKELAARIQQQTNQKVLFDSAYANGHATHYVQVGEEAELPVLIMVHGSPGALNAYEPYLLDTALQQKLNIIAVDRPGFGYSNFGKAEPSLAKQADALAAILTRFPDQPKILVGHSMGGPVIAKTLMDYPQAVDGIIMVAPAINPDDESNNWWRKVLDFAPIRWSLPPAVRVCNQEILPLKSELTAMLPDWQSIMKPVVVIQGEKDWLVRAVNADFAEKMLRHNAFFKKIIVPRGDHFILWSKPDLIKAAIIDMLNTSKKMHYSEKN